ncbi:MAG: bifunctional protein-serine/threonine kinase/phosphatase [Opitutales bacterium]
MNLQHAQYTTAGPVREINEDSLASWPPEGDKRLMSVGFASILADGVGGESRGEVASQLAVGTAVAALEKAQPYPVIPELLRTIFDDASRAIYDTAMGSLEQGSMSTTLVVSLWREDSLHVAHVGDTRVYLVRGGKIRQLTTDHSYITPSVKFRLTHEHKAMTDPRRSMLTRSVGHDPIVKFDLTRTELARGDIVVQCTDGLYGFVTAEEICDIVLHFSPEEACRYLASLAEKRQLDDNLSVQVTKVQELDPIAFRQGVPVYRKNGTASMSADLEPGQVLDERFEITELISRSGMACIYKGRDLRSGQTVALKVPLMQFESDVATFTRFQREEEIGRQLNHPYILKIFPVERAKSRPYLAMEFLEGQTLDRVMETTRPLPEREAAKITICICEALEHMHQRAIVHRDLKPQNIMVCADGSIRILDFGIAKASRLRRLTFTGFSPMMGTPDYMAPEQVNGRRGDQRTDIYSLGAMLYEMTTGKVPFEGESPYVTMNMRTTGDPVAPRKINDKITLAMEEIILHALARFPEERYATAAEMKAELENYDLVELTGRHKHLQAAKPWKRRFHMVPMIAAFVALQLALFALMVWYFSHHGKH